MGYRLSKIYTRTGDDGTTALSDNKRILKSDDVIELIGTLDELNAAIGLILCFSADLMINQYLHDIQQQLFNIGGEISYPQFSTIDKLQVQTLEQQIDALNKDLPPLKEFILPGGTKSAAFAHQARTIARRCERALVRLMSHSRLSNASILPFINRLSDFLFVLARHFNQHQQYHEIHWHSHRTKDKS
ncbi:MAG: cob(I)yrinic acid a,c-diamide adenosyltransferase [Francisellaceae bacterium]